MKKHFILGFLLAVFMLRVAAVANAQGSNGGRGVSKVESIPGGTRIEFHGMEIDGRARPEIGGPDRSVSSEGRSQPSLPSQLIVSAWTNTGFVGAVLNNPSDIALYRSLSERHAALVQELDGLKAKYEELRTSYLPLEGLRVTRDAEMRKNYDMQVLVVGQANGLRSRMESIVVRAHAENVAAIRAYEAARAAEAAKAAAQARQQDRTDRRGDRGK